MSDRTYEPLPRLFRDESPRLKCNSKIAKRVNNLLDRMFKNEKVSCFDREQAIMTGLLQEYPELFARCEGWLDRLTVIQHYGVGTRLLDVTQNALVALFFATEILSKEKADKEPDGVVYAFSEKQDDIDYSLEHPDIIDAQANPAFWRFKDVRSASRLVNRKIKRDDIRTRIVKPKLLTERQKRQHGWFYLFANKIGKDGSLEKESQHIDAEEMKIFIAGRAKSQIRDGLKTCFGISEHFLFPENVHIFAKELMTRASELAQDSTGIIIS